MVCMHAGVVVPVLDGDPSEEEKRKRLIKSSP